MSSSPAFDIIVASGRNGAMPHASVSDRTLRSGDLVTIDFGAEADGYFCDITRTLCIGRPTDRQRAVHDLVLRAQQAAIGAIAPGVPCREIDRAAREIITAAGHETHFGHATGHGIGMMIHEGPSLSALSKATLETGMVVTVEPGVYIPGWGGIRIEDMVLVTDRGAKLLTGLPRADSLTLDPHKGLFLPYGTGALLVRDGEVLRAVHAASAAYLPHAPEADEFYDPRYGPDLSRGFPGLRLWLAVKLCTISGLC